MVLLKANKDTEAGVMPGEQLLADMGKFNEALAQAGVLLDGQGLHPSAKGVRVRFSGSERRVVHGPFDRTQELVCGYWLWNCKDMDEAVAWLKRCPHPMTEDTEVEIRPLFEASDFGQDCPVSPVLPARGALPYLAIKGASDAIAYYQRVFGAQETFRLNAPDGSVLHCEMRVGPAAFMLSEERPEYGSRGPLSLGGTPVTVTFYVPDVDAVVERAVAAGATIGMPVADQFWGDRAGSITDPFGHQWMIATHKEEPSHEEMEKRMQAMFAQGGGAACG
jgi:uncharacterized glyoxalase superfamily protein PhnB